MTAHRFRSAFSPTPPERSIDELDTAICTLARQMNADSYRMLLLVREFDDRFGFAKWGFRTCAEWLAWRCGFSPAAAREKVRAAQALRSLPAISAAFADGRLSYSKARALTRVANEQNEDLLLAYAFQATAAQVEERCRQMRNAAPESTDVARKVWERRSLSVSRNPARGTVVINVELPAEDGELVARAIDSAVAAGGAAIGIELDSDREAGEGTGSHWRAQQADALVAIMKGYVGGHAAERGAASADNYQVVVHVDEKSLRGSASGRSDLPLETVRRLTCDCSLVAVIDDEHGAPLDVGRKQRNVSTALRRALWSRDRGCTFPGCGNTRFVDGHHIHHWAKGGETSLENLTLLCTFHHHLLHEGGFKIRRDENDEIYFVRADGRVIPRGGYRYEDIHDDFDAAATCVASAAAPTCSKNVSAEAFRAAERDEVREQRAVYRLAG